MRNLYLRIALVTVCLVLGAQTVAWAHVTVSPEEVPAEGFATLTVKVPNEKEIPTTEVRVEVPEGFTVSGVQPVPGWSTSSRRKTASLRPSPGPAASWVHASSSSSS